jgi:glycosyltransferase involved in cell wall biosynthesis
MGTKISILIPAKNESAFIRDCLDSILNQSYQNWEAIIVDDHSTDETSAIISSFENVDDRFRQLKNKGYGIIYALRTAYEASTGALITRMDADDKMRSDKLSVLSNKLEEHGLSHISVGGVNYFSSDKVRSGFKNYEEWLNQRTRTGTNFQDIFRECPIPSPNWMMYRHDLDLIGAFDSDRYPEDYDLAFRMCLKGFKVIPCETITHDWRDYPTRTSRTSDHYKDHTFTEIKWHYFNQFYRNSAKQLVIFGTGYRGKKLAAHLIDQEVDFQWVSHNPEKIGKHIYDVLIEPLDTFVWKNNQIIATIAKDKGRNEVNKMAVENNYAVNKDLIHFA